MKNQIYCIKRKISDLELLVFNVTVREIENNMAKICVLLSKNLHLGKYEYKFKNTYHEMSNTHIIRMYFRFENEVSLKDEKIINNLQISDLGYLIGGL